MELSQLARDTGSAWRHAHVARRSFISRVTSRGAGPRIVQALAGCREDGMDLRDGVRRDDLVPDARCAWIAAHVVRQLAAQMAHCTVFAFPRCEVTDVRHGG